MADVGALAREEAVHGDDLVAARPQVLAQVAADEAGPAGHHDPRHAQARPMPWYEKPARCQAARSSRLRPSTRPRPVITSATRSGSTQRNSSHSVRTTTTSAPAAACSGSAAMVMSL